ncbi:MAG: DNA glycosylase AlkZ-like family protein, partial [Candidatus Heimdallarchaeota archaeon]
EELKTYMGNAYSRILWNKDKKKTNEFMKECVENDLLVEVNVKDIQEPHYVLSKQLKNLKNIKNLEDKIQPIKFLSPFDNLVRERDYPKRLWNFVYKIECYTPAAQRIYGYFTLPILDGHKLIGRTDLKVHRKTGNLEIKSLHFESGIKLDDELLHRFKEGLQNFATFHSCQEIIMESMQPLKHKGKIKTLFS